MATELFDAVDRAVETNPLRLRDALWAVLGMHARNQSVTTLYCVACSEYGTDGWNRLVNFPCPTRRKIASALGIQEGGSE